MMDIFFAPHRYLDPGSGSILIQILIATFVGIAFTAKMMWGKISSIFRRDSAEENEPEDTNDSGPNLK